MSLFRKNQHIGSPHPPCVGIPRNTTSIALSTAVICSDTWPREPIMSIQLADKLVGRFDPIPGGLAVQLEQGSGFHSKGWVAASTSANNKRPAGWPIGMGKE